MFFTFIESILENVNDVVCLSFLSNEGEIYIFTTMTMISSKSPFLLLWWKIKPLWIKIIIISNIKLQIIFPNNFAVGYHEYKLCYCSCNYNKNNGFSNGNTFSRHGNYFSKWWYQYFLIKSPFNWIHTHNQAMKIETTTLNT